MRLNDDYQFLNLSRYLPWAFIAIFLCLGFFTFMIYSGYVMAFFLALIFYLLFRKSHRRILKWSGGRRTIAAAISTVTVFLLIMVPSIYIGFTLIEQGYDAYLELRDYVMSTRLVETLSSNEKLAQYIRLDEHELRRIQDALTTLSQYMGMETLKKGGTILANLSRFGLNFTFSIFILFFFFRSGDKLGPIIYRNLPFPDDMEREIGERMLAILDAVLQGNLLISFFQGVFIAIYFWIFGVTSPIFYGFLGGIFSLVPVLGTSIVWLPASIWLYAHEQTTAAILLGTFSLATFFVLENLVKPLLLDKKLNLHPLFLFLAILGGLQQFGIKGLILGPFLVTLFISFWEMITAWNENYNDWKKKNATSS